MVLVSKANKRAIFAYLLREGCIVVKKDGYLPQHQHVGGGVTNLEVMMIVKSLKSRGYLTDVFNWQWSYYVVTKEGVKYLIQQLGVSTDVVPATYTKKRPAAAVKVVDEDEKAAAAEETGMGR